MMLHYDVHEGEGPYCLLVHGILSSRAQWTLNVEALGRVCRPVVVELLGHGRSGAPDDPADYTPGAYASRFEEIRRAVDADRWFVVGQSLGAALTLRYTLDHSEHVIAQVFTNSASALADATWQETIAQTAPATAAHIERGGREAIEAMPIHPRHARRLPPAVHDALLDDARRLHPRGVAHTLRATVPGSSVRDRFAGTRVPTLLAHGVRERVFEESAAHARAALPGIEVVELDAGHAVNIHAADRFNAAVIEFFGRHA